MPVDQLVRRSARGLPQRYPLRPDTRSALVSFSPPFPQQQHSAVYPPQAQAHEAGDQETGSREQHPVFAHPEDQSRIFPVPAAPSMPPEKSPRLLVILVPHQYPYSARFTTIPAACTSSPKDRGTGNCRGGATPFIFLPDDAEKERTSTVHDSYIGKFPVAVVGD